MCTIHCTSCRRLPCEAVVDKELGSEEEEEGRDEAHDKTGEGAVEQPPHYHGHDREGDGQLDTVHVVQLLRERGGLVRAPGSSLERVI